jgi:polyhydroxyalkanoate synthesis regulator phasin
MSLQEHEVEKKVFLLKLLLKESDESMQDVIDALVNTGMFKTKEALKHLEELKQRGFVANDALTMIGQIEAKKAKEEFTLAN